MENFVLDNPERVRIFDALSKNRSMKFNDILRFTEMSSNKLSYQLNLMRESDFIINEDGFYSLSINAQKLIPYFSQIFKKEVGVLPVVLGIVRKDDKILLIQRKKMPYKGYWGLFGGKQICGETIPQTIEREVLEESGLEAKFTKANGVVYERLIENGTSKHSFLFVITSLVSDSDDVEEQNEGAVAWFDFDDVVNNRVKNIIPSDLNFLKKYSEREVDVEHVVMEERGEKLVLIE